MIRTLEDALSTMQSIHGMVEHMVLDVKNNRGTGSTPGQIKRTETTGE